MLLKIKILNKLFKKRLEKEKLLIKAQVDDAHIQNEQINKSKVIIMRKSLFDRKK